MHEELKKELIEYFESLGIEVCTDTNAHGYQGYFSNNKIEISRKIKRKKFVPTLLHEFSHYIHMKVEQNLLQTGGNVSVIFKLTNANSNDNKIEKNLKEELFGVTNFVDKSSLCNLLKSYKEKLNNKIDKLEHQIKKEYPNFKNKKHFDSFLCPSKEEKEIVSHTENFPFDNNKTLLAWKELVMARKEKNRICKHINKYKKYYMTPTELFARFIEGLYIDNEKVKNIAPNTYKRFFNLLEKGYYHELKNVLQIVNQTATI